MKVFANREIRILFRTVLAVWAVALALTQGIVWYATHAFSFGLLLVFLLLGGCLWGVLFRYFQRQSALLEQAVQQIQSCLDGNSDARLDCDREGELYRLFHSVNALAAVLSAHADNEQREKRFLKNTIADISHQPLPRSARTPTFWSWPVSAAAIWAHALLWRPLRVCTTTSWRMV